MSLTPGGPSLETDARANVKDHRCRCRMCVPLVFLTTADHKACCSITNDLPCPGEATDAHFQRRNHLGEELLVLAHHTPGRVNTAMCFMCGEAVYMHVLKHVCCAVTAGGYVNLENTQSDSLPPQVSRGQRPVATDEGLPTLHCAAADELSSLIVHLQGGPASSISRSHVRICGKSIRALFRELKMGEIRIPAQMFLWSLSIVYLFAFASIYIQVPGRKSYLGVQSLGAALLLLGKLASKLFSTKLKLASTCEFCPYDLKRPRPTLKGLPEAQFSSSKLKDVNNDPDFVVPRSYVGEAVIPVWSRFVSNDACGRGLPACSPSPGGWSAESCYLLESAAELLPYVSPLQFWGVNAGLSSVPSRPWKSTSGCWGATCICSLNCLVSSRVSVWKLLGWLGRLFKRQPEWSLPRALCLSLGVACSLVISLVGGDFLRSEWDSLLLEAGFLAILVAPCGLLRRIFPAGYHDPLTFWLTRWLLFRLVLCTGLSKLASGDPSWWDLTALSRHYETQASPTPLAWYAHQLPRWVSKLGVVYVMAAEIAVPLLMFFASIRSLRIHAFYIQVFLQLCFILLGGFSLSHLLTIALSFSLLDDEQFSCQKKKPKTKTWGQFLVSSLSFLMKLAVYFIIVFSALKLFKLEVNWEKKLVTSKITFSHSNFEDFVRLIQAPTIWVGVLSLTWEVVSAFLKCLTARGILNKLLAVIQWAIFTAAAAAVFALSLVPYTAVAGMSGSKILPEVRKAYGAVENFQLVSAYGIQHRMVPPAGRPEIVIEGSADKKTWTELNFMYRPDGLSEVPPVVGPYQPRLDWLLWEAALGEPDQSHWFTGLMQRLLEGKQEVENLLQVDEAQYPFSQTPPAYVRAKVYHYHFTQTTEDGTHPQAWWKRQYVREFFPTVHLGDPKLDALLSDAGLKENLPVQPSSDTPVAQALGVLRGQLKGLSGPLVLLTLFATVASILLLKALFSRPHTHKGPKPKSEHKSKKPKEASKAAEKSRAPPSQGGKKDNSEERKQDSDRSPRKRK
ncbi:hypothetical protein NFI96_015521 [Prochilodus magdalenae]|nr:hypothetical protein NFI96_015521 [Prochilodus magdalenae]